jgi:hypothetical protein
MPNKSKYHFINELKLPPIPSDMEQYCYQSLTDSTVTDERASFFNIYVVVDPLQTWLNENVMDIQWKIQTFTGDADMHVDRTSTTNLLYFLDMGGDDVVTTFYHEDDHTQLESMKLQPRIWYTFKSDILHTVTNIESGRTRIALVASIFKRMPVQRRQSALFLNEQYLK